MLASEGDALDEDFSSGNWIPIAAALCSVPLFFGLETTALIIGVVLAGCILLLFSVFVWVKCRFPRPVQGVIGFFHPFADGGGGGERVLWAAVQALQQSRPDLRIVIYCGEDSSAGSLSQQASSRFNLKVQPSFHVVPLKSRNQLLPASYPRFTMVRQAAASVCVAAQGLRIIVPSVWIDTTGWAFPYPLVRMTGASVAAYVHYPTISTDMLSRVRDRAATFNNNTDVASSAAKSGLKLFYYQCMALLYGAVGGCANVAMVNSSWTRRHISQLWWRRARPHLVYPPADTAALQALPLDRRLKRVYVISVAQFRPEKDHQLQLRAFAAARARAERLGDSSVADAILSARLQLVGGCRGIEDEARLEELRQLAKELNLSDEIVEFRVNVPFEELHELLGDAVAGLHSMIDEHFGISVVEYMAAGAVPIAHNSGGPREDIVLPEPRRDGCGPGQRTGFLCRTVEQYTDAIVEVVGMGQVERLEVAAAARRRASAFSDERFKNEFIEAVGCLLPSIATP